MLLIAVYLYVLFLLARHHLNLISELIAYDRFMLPNQCCLPWASHGVGWRPVKAPPNSDRSGRSHRGRTTENSAAYRSFQHDGCTATVVYSETLRSNGKIRS